MTRGKIRLIAATVLAALAVIWIPQDGGPGQTGFLFVTVGTVPLGTPDAYRGRGQPEANLKEDAGAAARPLRRLPALGIGRGRVTPQPEDEGGGGFARPFATTMAALAQRSSRYLGGKP